jgi:hypothetical protein
MTFGQFIFAALTATLAAITVLAIAAAAVVIIWFVLALILVSLGVF